MQDVEQRTTKQVVDDLVMSINQISAALNKLANNHKRVFSETPYNGIANSKHKPRQVRMRGK